MKHWTLALACLLAVAWFVLFAPAAVGGPAGYIVVEGRSMEPLLHSGDLVITREQGSYETGDVVAFRAEGGIVIHRIIGGDGTSGFVMQGDNKAGPDVWRPAEDDIIGAQWLHLPGAGHWLEWAREPQHLSALAGGLAAMTLAGGKRLQDKRRRKRGKHMRHGEDPNNPTGSGHPPLPAPTWAWLGLGLASTLALVFGALALRAFTTAPERNVTFERASYEQAGEFEYTILTEPATLYPEGRVGPVSAAAGTPANVEAPPVYTRLARSIDVGFRYTLAGAAGDARGTIAADLRLEAAGEEGWTKVIPLAPVQDFAGTEATLKASVDLASVQALIETIEKETGFVPPSYELAVVPRVTATAAVGGEPARLEYAPAFTFRYTKTTITPDQALRSSELRSIGETVARANEVSLGAFALSVSAARPLLSVLALLAVGAAGAFAAVVFLGLGQDETVKAQVRYHTTLVRVAEADHNGSHRVRVASIADLARVANRDGGVIFSQRLPDGDLYFVPDGAITYEFAVPAGADETANGFHANGNKSRATPKPGGDGVRSSPGGSGLERGRRQ